MQIHDRWHLTHPKDPNSRKCGKHRLVPSAVHGTGSRWQVRYRDPESGRQVKENFAEKDAANARAVEIDHGHYRGVLPVKADDRRITFREYAESWRAAQPHRPGTEKDVAQSLRCYAYPAFGDRRLAAVRNSDVQAWVTGMVKAGGLAPGTARKNFQKVKAVFNAAVRDGIITRSPCAGVRPPEVPHTEVQPLSREQVAALVDAMPDRYRALVVLAVGSGLRPGELFGLHVRHVDFLRRTVRVDQQLQQTAGHGVYVCPPKTKRSHRTVPVPQTVIDALAAHLEAHPAGPDEHLFRMVGGGPIVRTSFFSTVWAPAVERAGLPKGTRMHDLRHTYASVLIAHGRGPKTAADRLGDTVAVAMHTYAHLFKTEDEDTREAVEAFLVGEAPERESAPNVPRTIS